MAKPTWLILNPSAGSGNGQISNSAFEHTGRVARTGIVTVTGENVEQPKTYQVTQTPKTEFVSFTNGSEMAVSKEGGVVTATGKSNSKMLNFAWVGEVSSISIPATYTAAGSSANNNEEIPGDPGADAEYEFSLKFDEFPENDYAEEREFTLKVTAEGAQFAQIVLKQAAADAFLEISPESITIPQSGTPAVSVQVTANTSWSVS